MITIKEALPNEFNLIQDLAYRIWPSTYRDIVSAEQLKYMLDWFYSIEELNKNAAEREHTFLLIREDEMAVGFASYGHSYNENPVTRIQKIYMLPEMQGKGFGKLMISEIEKRAIEAGSEKLSLNVNKHNKAKYFYEKLGFEETAQEDIPIGNGFLMEDFIMEKQP